MKIATRPSGVQRHGDTIDPKSAAAKLAEFDLSLERIVSVRTDKPE